MDVTKYEFISAVHLNNSENKFVSQPTLDTTVAIATGSRNFTTNVWPCGPHKISCFADAKDIDIVKISTGFDNISIWHDRRYRQYILDKYTILQYTFLYHRTVQQLNLGIGFFRDIQRMDQKRVSHTCALGTTQLTLLRFIYSWLLSLSSPYVSLVFDGNLPRDTHFNHNPMCLKLFNQGTK